MVTPNCLAGEEAVGHAATLASETLTSMQNVRSTIQRHLLYRAPVAPTRSRLQSFKAICRISPNSTRRFLHGGAGACPYGTRGALAAILIQDDDLHVHGSYGNAGDKEWDWELAGLCIPTEVLQ